MLDPVSAVSVASAVVQFVDFSTRLFAVGKELHGSTTGRTEELIQLDEVYAHLQAISKKLSWSAQPQSAVGATQEELELYRLADLCQQDCDVFLTKIRKVAGKTGAKRTFKTFRDALKIVWSQKAIDGLEMRLERYQRELTLALISHLGSAQSSITRGLQTLIADSRRVESNQKRQIDEIVNLLADIQKEQKSRQNEAPKDRNLSSNIEHLAMQLPWAFEVASQMILQQRFLSSLYFPALKLRHSRIDPAHDRTFRWIFQKPRTATRLHPQWQNQQQRVEPEARFLQWLQYGDGIFWISGKPGSGKSTLMKYITGSLHTGKALFEWANPGKSSRGPRGAKMNSREAFPHIPRTVKIGSLKDYLARERTDVGPETRVEDNDEEYIYETDSAVAETKLNSLNILRRVKEEKGSGEKRFDNREESANTPLNPDSTAQETVHTPVDQASSERNLADGTADIPINPNDSTEGTPDTPVNPDSSGAELTDEVADTSRAPAHPINGPSRKITDSLMNSEHTASEFATEIKDTPMDLDNTSSDPTGETADTQMDPNDTRGGNNPTETAGTPIGPDDTAGDSDLNEATSDTQMDTDDTSSSLGAEIRVVTASFYFWSAGTSMQKSQHGLFQALLYEIFSHGPDLIQEVCPERWHLLERGENQQPWTIEEISDTLNQTIALASTSVRFCFFIDGVDEYVGDHHAMVRLLESFARLPNVKLCVSSRPWNVFEDAFGQDSERKIYLQDLTSGDIEQYVRDNFSQHPAWNVLKRNSRYNAIATEIVEKAQGVFLWVFLVVRSLLDGLSNGDSLSLLQDRLRRIPTDLRNFFKYILESLDSTYDQHVAHFFLAAVDTSEPLPLMAYAFFDVEFENTDYVFELDNNALDPYEVIICRQEAQRQLNGRCKGLLETYKDSEGTDFFRHRVGFLHRTVRDFFLTQEIRQEFENRLSGILDIYNSLLRACIAMLKKSPRVGEKTGTCPRFRYLVDLALHSARRSELATGKPASKLLDEMAYVLNDIGFYKSYWGETYESPRVQDSFLALAIERGLLLYISEQLDYRSRTSISSRTLELGENRKRYLLDHALVLPKSNSFDEPDVSDVVKFLLKKGCDPNVSSHGQTPFSRFLLRLSEADSGEDAETLELNASYRLKILKHLLSHGADLNFVADNGSWPVWATFLQRLQTRGTVPKHKYQYHLDILELLLSFGADPNLPTPGACSCCPVSTPWMHFVKWGWNMHGFRTTSFHQQEFLARICALLLEHGADSTMSLLRTDPTASTTKTRKTMALPAISLVDIIREGFPARLSAPILATLPLEIQTETDCSPRPGLLPVPESSEPGRFQFRLPAFFWNPFSWWYQKETYPDSVVTSLTDIGFTCSPSTLPISLLLAVENRFTSADLTQRCRTAQRHPSAKPIFIVGPCMFPSILRALIKEVASSQLEEYAGYSVRHIVRDMIPAKLRGARVHSTDNLPWLALPAVVLCGSPDARDTVTGLLFFIQCQLLRQKLRDSQTSHGFLRSTRQATRNVEVKSSEGKSFTMKAEIPVYSGPPSDLIPQKTKPWDPACMLTDWRLKPIFDSIGEEEDELKQVGA